MSGVIVYLDIELAKLRKKNALVIVEVCSRPSCKIANANAVVEEYMKVAAECDKEIARLTGLMVN
jgi:hypothetical protein